MPRASHSSLQKISAALLEIYQAASLDELPHVWLRAVRGLLGADVYTVDSFDVARMRGTFTIWPERPAADPEVLNTWLHQHPSIGTITAPEGRHVVKWSDFRTLRQFRQTALYHDFFRGQEIRAQLAVAFVTGRDTTCALAFNRRGPDFTEEERAILELVLPHLQQTYRHCEQRGEIAQTLEWLRLATDGDAALGVSLDGKVVFASDAAVELYRRYFGEALATQAPERLLAWLANPGRTRDPLVFEREWQRLAIRASGPLDFPAQPHFAATDTPPTRGWVLRLEEERSTPTPATLAHLRLTPRETEVLAWMAQGKRNSEIAIILGTKPRTVEKHVENVLSKLGVENRGAAIARAWEVS